MSNSARLLWQISPFCRSTSASSAPGASCILAHPHLQIKSIFIVRSPVRLVVHPIHHCPGRPWRIPRFRVTFGPPFQHKLLLSLPTLILYFKHDTIWLTVTTLLHQFHFVVVNINSDNINNINFWVGHDLKGILTFLKSCLRPLRPRLPLHSPRPMNVVGLRHAKEFFFAGAVWVQEGLWHQQPPSVQPDVNNPAKQRKRHAKLPSGSNSWKSESRSGDSRAGAPSPTYSRSEVEYVT